MGLHFHPRLRIAKRFSLDGSVPIAGRGAMLKSVKNGSNLPRRRA